MMKPEKDYSRILQKAKDSLDEDWIREFLCQIATYGILTSQLSESKLYVSKENAEEGVLFWARLFQTMKSLYEKGDIQWLDFYTGETVKPDFDFKAYYQSSRMVGGEHPLLEKAFPFLTSQGIQKHWKPLYKAYIPYQSGNRMNASKYKRVLKLDLENAKGVCRTSLDRAAKFAILTVGDGVGVSTLANFIVENRLTSNHKESLHEKGYIARVGNSTQKIYPKGKPTKAHTSFHTTPDLLKDYGDLMWSIYKRESIREGVQKSLEIDSKEKYEEEYMKSWNRSTKNGVES